MDISPFYISFVLAPLASNASELLAAYKFAAKKTRATVTVSLSQLEGAAIMNNTFCLGIFLFLIWSGGGTFKQPLIWAYTAETIVRYSLLVSLDPCAYIVLLDSLSFSCSLRLSTSHVKRPIPCLMGTASCHCTR